jgi:hypothetical protein
VLLMRRIDNTNGNETHQVFASNDNKRNRQTKKNS